MGKKDDAKRLFEEQLSMYPELGGSPQRHLLAWAAWPRSEGNKKLARAYYQKLAENYRYFYYANLARERMAKVGDEAVDPPLLESLPRPPAPPADWAPPADNVRAQKAQLLANAALYDFAVAEMQAASAGSPPWEAKSVAEIYNEQGSYIRAIETLKRAVPGYFAAEIPQIPRPVWEGLFPAAVLGGIEA